MKVSRGKRPTIGEAAEAAANFSTDLWPVFLDDIALTSARFLMANNISWQQKLFPDSFQIYDVDAITSLFAYGSQGGCHLHGFVLQTT